MHKPLITWTLIALLIVLAACDSEPQATDAERLEDEDIGGSSWRTMADGSRLPFSSCTRA